MNRLAVVLTMARSSSKDSYEHKSSSKPPQLSRQKSPRSATQQALHNIPKKSLFSGVMAGLLFWLPVIIFVLIANQVYGNRVIPFDASVLLWLHSWSNPALDTLAVALTDIGGAVAVSLYAAALVAALLLCGRYRMATFVFTAASSALAANVVLKILFQRSRPELWERLVIEHSYSFPSGHAMMSATFACIVVAMLWQTRYKLAAIIGGALFVVLIGLTRMYLGVHYPTDVLAGWCLGAASVTLIYMAVFKWPYIARRFVH